jgi:hypothetical protein
MTTAPLTHHAASVDTTDYEPFLLGDEAIGEVSWIRNGGSEGTILAVGLWRCEPRSFPYPFGADETIHALDGVLDITLADSTVVTLEKGDIASFAKGTDSTWTVREPFLKLFVVSGA